MTDPTTTEPVTIFEGDGGYEVHVDGGLFTVVDAEPVLRTGHRWSRGHEWGPFPLREITALHKVIGAALGDPTAARLAVAEALLRREHERVVMHDGHPMFDPQCDVCAFLAAGDPDA